MIVIKVSSNFISLALLKPTQSVIVKLSLATLLSSNVRCFSVCFKCFYRFVFYMYRPLASVSIHSFIKINKPLFLISLSNCGNNFVYPRLFQIFATCCVYLVGMRRVNVQRVEPEASPERCLCLDSAMRQMSWWQKRDIPPTVMTKLRC